MPKNVSRSEGRYDCGVYSTIPYALGRILVGVYCNKEYLEFALSVSSATHIDAVESPQAGGGNRRVTGCDSIRIVIRKSAQIRSKCRVDVRAFARLLIARTCAAAALCFGQRSVKMYRWGNKVDMMLDRIGHGVGRASHMRGSGRPVLINIICGVNWIDRKGQ